MRRGGGRGDSIYAAKQGVHAAGPMRVLHTFKVYDLEREGGVQRAITALAAGEAGGAVKHDFFTLADNGPWTLQPNADPLTVHAARRTGRCCATDFSVSARRRFRALAREADIVHYHLPWPFVHWLDRAVPSETPRVATYHADICRNPLLKRLYEPMMERFLHRLDAVIATSPVYAKTSPVLQRVTPERLYVATLGVAVRDDQGVAVDQAQADLRARVGEAFMLFLGATRRYKGAAVAIEALRYTDARLVIAGECVDRAALTAHAGHCGVADRVVFLGRVSEAQKWALLRLCRALVMPSTLRSEAFGLALVEAGAAERPAITCEIGTGTSYVVRHGETGWVVPPHDAPALGAAMAQAQADPAQAAALGRAGFARYRNCFTATAYAQRMHGVYDDLIGQGRTAPASCTAIQPPETNGRGPRNGVNS